MIVKLPNGSRLRANRVEPRLWGQLVELEDGTLLYAPARWFIPETEETK